MFGAGLTEATATRKWSFPSTPLPTTFSPDELSLNCPILTAGHVWFLGLSGRQFLLGSSNFFLDLLLPRPSYTYPSTNPFAQTSQQFCFSDWTPNWHRPSQVRVAASRYMLSLINRACLRFLIRAMGLSNSWHGYKKEMSSSMFIRTVSPVYCWLLFSPASLILLRRRQKECLPFQIVEAVFSSCPVPEDHSG